jgi:hypothetical protein
VPTPRKWKNEAARKRAYRERKKAEKAAPRPKPDAATPPPDAPTTQDDAQDAPVSAPMAAVLSSNPGITVLESIRDNPSALDSDRIRATTEIQKMQALDALQEKDGGSDLYDLRRIIEALPVHERLAWLKGEVDEHRAAGAYDTNTNTTDEEDA